MTEDILNILLNSGKVQDSEEWDAIYQDELPIAIAPSTAELEEALSKLDASWWLWIYCNLEKKFIFI